MEQAGNAFEVQRQALIARNKQRMVEIGLAHVRTARPHSLLRPQRAAYDCEPSCAQHGISQQHGISRAPGQGAHRMLPDGLGACSLRSCCATLWRLVGRL